MTTTSLPANTKPVTPIPWTPALGNAILERLLTGESRSPRWPGWRELKNAIGEPEHVGSPRGVALLCLDLFETIPYELAPYLLGLMEASPSAMLRDDTLAERADKVTAKLGDLLARLTDTQPTGLPPWQKGPRMSPGASFTGPAYMVETAYHVPVALVPDERDADCIAMLGEASQEARDVARETLTLLGDLRRLVGR